MNNSIFVDLQGFIVNEKFIVKEFAVLKHNCELTHLVFKQAMDWNLLTKAERSRACWLTANHHGFQWTDGNIDYRKAKKCIQTALFKNIKLKSETSESNETTNTTIATTTFDITTESIIYVKGIQKVQWLKDIIGDAIKNYNVSIRSIDVDYSDIRKLDFLKKPKPKTQAMHCIYHTKYCAMENVMILNYWWLERNNTLTTEL